MRGAAACLKVQVNNDDPYIENYIDYYDEDSIEVQYEQLAVFSLLKAYFMGRGAWDGLKKTSDPTGRYTIIGTSIYKPIPSDEYPHEYIPANMALACLTEHTLKAGLKSFGEGVNRSYDLPLNWGDLVDATPFDQLQQLIEEYGGSYGRNFNYMVMTINHKPATLTLHRCTMEEVNSLFSGDHDPHVDVFDAVKEMLVGNWPPLDENGLSQAVYDAATDTIIFKSDFSISADAAAA